MLLTPKYLHFTSVPNDMKKIKLGEKLSSSSKVEK
jgi:hypothetical protein